jgi:hypothetical protein
MEGGLRPLFYFLYFGLQNLESFPKYKHLKTPTSVLIVSYSSP